MLPDPIFQPQPPSWPQDTRLERAVLALLALCALIALALSLTGCTLPEKAYVQANRATIKAIGPAHRRYVEADPTLTPEQRQARADLLDSWEDGTASYERQLGIASEGASAPTKAPVGAVRGGKDPGPDPPATPKPATPTAIPDVARPPEEHGAP